MKISEQIECPHCHKSFPLTAALSGNIEAQVSAKFAAKIAEQESIYKKQLADMEKHNIELKKTYEAEAIVNQKKQEKIIEEKLKKKSAVETEDLKNQLEEEKKRADEAQSRELELRKRERELQAQKLQMDLELERKLDERAKVITEETEKRLHELSDKKISDLTYKNEQMAKLLEEANRKASQGSQQAQGESFEKKLEELLPEAFSTDEFRPVPKGKNGSDIIHIVKSKSGNIAGQMSLEAKDTINFSEKWIDKLKEDQRAEGSDLAVLITKAKPEGMTSGIEFRDGVWIVVPGLAVAFIGALREQLLKVHQIRMANTIPADQKEEIFRFLTGTKFKQSMETDVETVTDMIDELTTEQSAFTRIWKARGVKLNKLLASKAALYGDLQGILGRSLPTIERLELTAPKIDGE